jgi:hypothetical protein
MAVCSGELCGPRGRLLQVAQPGEGCAIFYILVVRMNLHWNRLVQKGEMRLLEVSNLAGRYQVMKRTLSSSYWVYWLCMGAMLMLGLGVPVITMAADASPIVGNWEGTLDPGAQPKKRIVVHISAAQDGSLSGTIDYPDQDISGVLITAITFKGAALHFESASAQGSYDGTSNKDNSEVAGTWKQGGTGVNLILKRTP